MYNSSIISVILVGVLLLISSYAICQDRTAEAKASFESGVALYKEGSYIEAANASRSLAKPMASNSGVYSGS